MGTRGTRAVAAVLLAAGLLAGCQQVDPAEPGPSTAVEGSPGDGGDAAPEPGTTVAAADNSVEAPGPLTDRLYRPDMLIFSREALSEDMVREVRALPQVAAVEEIGLAQVTIENRALTVAAVDAATYRRFAPATSAQTQVVWNRVAGGEVAVPEEVAKRLEDEDGFITLGSGNDAPTVHVGAYAPQATTIDLVLNKAWVDDLEGMVFGNGLLISTDEDDPSTIRKPVQQIVGDVASVQDLDIASRLGLDPGATQTAFLTGGSIASVVGTFNYESIGGGRIAPDPAWVSANIATEVVPILGSVTCHRALFPQLRAALEEVVARGLAAEIHPGEYAGCYYPRFIAGSTTLSNHSFGLALDMNVPGNGRGTVGEFDREVVDIFKQWGFAWGGDWSYTDPMHFELSQVVDPR
jgi:ABC-type amino acid transport substrate-binding protein